MSYQHHPMALYTAEAGLVIALAGRSIYRLEPVGDPHGATASATYAALSAEAQREADALLRRIVALLNTTTGAKPSQS